MKGEIVYIRDATADSRIECPEHAKSEGIASMLSIPLVSHSRFIGALRLYASEERRFPERELDFVRTLALEHARLYSRLRDDHNSLIEDFHTWFEKSAYNPLETPRA